MKRRISFNPNRKIASLDNLPNEAVRAKLAKRAKYGGNPEHKSRPGDYGLSPPSSPRPGKTLCDKDRSFSKAEAEQLLKEGLRKGMTSSLASEWPQNVWAVSLGGEVFEAQLENSVQGIYHGYPLQENDSFRAHVISEWKQR